MRRRTAFTFAEIIVAILVVTVLAVPLFYLVTSTRTDTSKAINYLRAMELANEVIEWANVIPFAEISKLAQMGGSLVEDVGGTLKSVPVPLKANSMWSGLATQIQYSDQYPTAFFYRSITVASITHNVPWRDYVAQITVTVAWNEGKKPDNVNDQERMRKITLYALVFNDRKLDY